MNTSRSRIVVLFCLLLGSTLFLVGLVALTDVQALRLNTLMLATTGDGLGTESKPSYGIAWGDVDNDGDLDLAVADSDVTRLFLNEEGSIAPTPVWTGDGSDVVAWGDVDNDGDLDLAMGARFYLNNGGVLAPTHSWQAGVGDGARSIAWGDVNGDGWLDLVVGNHGNSRLYINLGAILAVSPTWEITNSQKTRSVALGDVDNDGDLDLAVGNGVTFQGERNRLYLNVDGVFETTAAWSSAESEPTQSVAWGDVDNDGDLDLAVGNWDEDDDTDFNRVYYNHNGTLETAASWTANDSDNTFAVAWGDANGDGWLDLVAGNFSVQSNNRVYLNDGSGTLETVASWVSADTDLTNAIAWGDANGDGTLELVAGNNALNKLYQNETQNLATDGVGIDTLDSESLAWGDVDGDGDLDLALSDISSIKLYTNSGGQLTQIASIPLANGAPSLAWGDVDEDGDLDLAAAGDRGRFYLNTNGVLGTNPAWQSAENLSVKSVAWGDVDGDGDLDLALGVYNAGNRLYLNEGSTLATAAAWQSADADKTNAVAWGDVDGDGDLDLAVANDSFQANKIYFNDKGVLQTTAGWISTDAENSNHTAWGDVDGDGDLDLAVANDGQVNQLYINNAGVLETTASWVSTENDNSKCVAWGDMDGDGDLDLAFGNGSGLVGELNRVHINKNGTLEAAARWISVESEGTGCIAWGDVNGDGRLDLAAANANDPSRIYINSSPAQLPNGATSAARVEMGSADFYAQSTIHDGIVPIPYTLFQPDSQPAGHVRFFFSLNGGDNWRVAVPTTDTVTSGLAQSPTGSTHVFNWDTFASGFFGQSDNVVLRVEVGSTGSPTIGVPFPIQRPHVSAHSLPFRVRGTQIRVMQDDAPATDAIIYRQTVGATTFQPFGMGETLFQTDQNGYLNGGGALALGERLVALLPVETTDDYTFYHTSATATEMGVKSFEIVQAGVQTLTVSAENPLLLFDLDISLEWAAHNDSGYLNDFRGDMATTSHILFDLTNGQVALGDVRVHFNREQWHTSDVIVFASNTTRPSADAGGIVSTFITDTHISSGEVITQAYIPGQVRMPAKWNRFGSTNSDFEQDWSLAMAHELSHYLLFQLDNYLGISPAGNLTLVDCKNSVMTQAYSTNYSEFTNDTNWTGDCLDTVAARTTGRNDWATITKFYPMLFADRDNPGPFSLPLGVTKVLFNEPDEPIETLDNLIIEVQDEIGALLATSSALVEVVLVKTGDSATPHDDHLISLGSPSNGRIVVRGAAAGDRLCVYDNRQTTQAGCIDALTGASDSVRVSPLGAWNPRISIIPPISNTLLITVTEPSATELAVQVYPATLFSDTLVPTAVTMAMQPVGNGVFSQTVVLDAPTFRGHVRVWDSPTGRESLVSYYFGGGWGPTYVGWGPTYVGWGPTYVGWGPTYVGWGTNKVGWGIGRTGWNAPVQSANGQVSVFDMDNVLGPTPPYILQGIPAPADLPSWLTPIGQAYQFIAPIPLTGTYSILFNYLERDVPDGVGIVLQAYFQADGEENWQPLPTEVNDTYNFAAARLPAQGIFVLAATIKVKTLNIGFNDVTYPVATTRLITEAFASLDGSYLSIYQSADEEWQLYDPAVLEPFDPLVNQLKFTKLYMVYDIYATQPVTYYVPIDAQTRRTVVQNNNPPMFVYGWVTSTVGSPLGTPVTAYIDDELCGETTTQAVGDGFGYVMQIMADGNCGTHDAITIITSQNITRTVRWNNDRAYFVPLSSGTPTAINVLNTALTDGSVHLLPLWIIIGVMCSVTIWHVHRRVFN